MEVYKNIVNDIIQNKYLGPKTLLENKKDWICYCNTTLYLVDENEVDILTGILNYLHQHNINNIIFILFDYLAKDIEIIQFEASYESIYEYIQTNGNMTWKYLVITTENYDFIYYEHDEKDIDVLCGPSSIVQKTFLNWDFETMKSNFFESMNAYNHQSEKFYSDFFSFYENINTCQNKLFGM